MRSDLLACYPGFRDGTGIPGFKKGINAKGMRGGALSARLMVKGPLTDAHFCNPSLFHLPNSCFNQL